MNTIFSPNAPNPIGPYSQALKSEGFVFCSGQIPVDPARGTLVDGDVAAQALQALTNLHEVLKAAGLGPADVVKTTIFLLDMADFASVNTVYATFFGEHKPARSTVAVAGLPMNARVEIDAIARVR